MVKTKVSARWAEFREYGLKPESEMRKKERIRLRWIRNAAHLIPTLFKRYDRPHFVIAVRIFGSRSGSVSQRYGSVFGSGSGSFHQAKIVRLYFYYFVTFYDILSLMNGVNQPSQSKKQKN